MNKSLSELDFSPESIPLRRSVWLIYFCAAAILLVLLGYQPLLSNEGECAESIRMLLDGGDIFAPDRQTDIFSQRWLGRVQALAAMVMGESEFSWRFMSIIPALLLLGGTMLLADDIFGRREMCCAGWMLIGSYGFIYWGRNASNFIFLAAWCVWCAVILNRNNISFLLRTIFFLLFFTGTCWWGICFLLAMPGIMLAFYPGWKKDFLRISSIGAMVLALVLTAAVLFGLLWHPEIRIADYPCRIGRQFINSFQESLHLVSWTEYGIFGRYRGLLNLLRLLFPWSLPALYALWVMCRNFRELPGKHKMLTAGILLLMIMSGIFSARRWQYQLCQVPFFLIICAGTITGNLITGKYQEMVDSVMRWSASLVGSFAATVFVIWPLWDMIFQGPMPGWIVCGIPVLGLLALGFLIFDTGAVSAVEKVSGMQGRWSGYILSWVCLNTAIFAVGSSALGIYRTGKPFWETCGGLAQSFQPSEVIFAGDVPNRQSLCYMKMNGTPVYAGDVNELEAVLEKNLSGKALIILRNRDFETAQNIWCAAGWECPLQKPSATEEGQIRIIGGENLADDFSAYNIVRKKLVNELK